jgi:hypothetical protein
MPPDCAAVLNPEIYGVNLCEHNRSLKTETFFAETNEGIGTIRRTIKKHLDR